MSNFACLIVLAALAISNCGSDTNVGPSAAIQNVQDSAYHTLVLKGIFDSSGNRLLRIEKPALYKRSIRTPVQPEKGKYMVLVTYDNGDSIVQVFNALVAGDREGADAQHGFFECELPVTRKIETIRILQRPSRKLLKEFSRKDIEIRN